MMKIRLALAAGCLAVLAAAPAALAQNSAASPAAPTFTKSLRRGAAGAEVQRLQEFLKAQPDVYPEGQVTGYFGALTERAVQRFQAKNGIEQTGTVGPKTRARLNAGRGADADLGSREKAPAAPSATARNFTCPAELITRQALPTLAMRNGVKVEVSGPEQNWIMENCKTIPGVAPPSPAKSAVYACPEELRTRRSLPTLAINNGVSREVSGPEQDWVQANCPDTQGTRGQGWTYNQPAMAKLPACGANPLLSVSPIDPAVTQRLVPLGHIGTPHHAVPMDHMEYVLPEDAQMNTLLTPVKAAADMHIIGARQSLALKDGKVVNDRYWSIAFTPCKDVIFYFEAMSDVSGALKKAIAESKSPELDEGDNVTALLKEYRIDYAAKAGEVIGWSGGPGFTGKTLDWGVYDMRISPLGFLRTSKIIPDWRTAYTTCPIDYYPSALKSELYAKFDRKVEPRCGEVMQDLAGTIQGNWTAQADAAPEAGDAVLMGIVHDNIDPSAGILAANGVLVKGGGAVDFTPQHQGQVNREPSEVRADGKIYCYENGTHWPVSSAPRIQGRVLVQLQADGSLKAEQQNKSCDGNYSFVSPLTYKR